MKLHVFPPSPNARKVQAVAHHLGLAPEIVMVDLTAGDQRKEDYLAVNPNGLMPTLVDGDYVLWESNAIMQYLCSKKSGQTLFPDDPQSRADISRWQCWQLAHFGPACGTLTFEHMVKPFFGDTSGPDQAKVEAAEEQFHKYAKVLDHHLRGRDWLVGDHLTLADLAVAAFLTYREPAKIPVDGYGEVMRWLGKVEELDCWKATAPALAA